MLNFNLNYLTFKLSCPKFEVNNVQLSNINEIF